MKIGCVGLAIVLLVLFVCLSLKWLSTV